MKEKGIRRKKKTDRRARDLSFSLQIFNLFNLASQFSGSWDDLLCNKKQVEDGSGTYWVQLLKVPDEMQSIQSIANYSFYC